MVSIYDIKPQFQNILRPIVRFCAKLGITPNQVTIAAIILSAITGGIVYIYRDISFVLFIVPFVMLMRMALNAIDGMLAKEHQMQTKLGNILNEIGDVVSDAVLFLPFAVVASFSPTWIVVIVVLSVISEMTGVMGQVIGASRRYDGPIGKSDRAFIFGLLAILVGLNWITALWVSVLLVITACGIALNIVTRIKRALKEVK